MMAIFKLYVNLKAIFKLSCLFVFLYQSIDLLNDYSMGKTIISLDVVLLEEEPLPAVTVCTKNWLSIEKLKEFPEYHEIYERYIKLNQEYNYLTDTGNKYLKSHENVTVLLRQMFYTY